MKKMLYLLLAALLCAGLAACAPQQSDTTPDGEAGNYYDDLTSEAGEDSFTVTGTAHIEDELTLLYINAETETEVSYELNLQSLNLQSNSGLTLYHKFPDGLMLGVAGTYVEDPSKATGSFPLSEGKNALIWYSEKGSSAKFTLTLSGLDGVEVSCFDEGFDDLPEIELGFVDRITTAQEIAVIEPSTGEALHSLTAPEDIADFIETLDMDNWEWQPNPPDAEQLGIIRFLQGADIVCQLYCYRDSPYVTLQGGALISSTFNVPDETMNALAAYFAA